jgi:hypothetical protein
MIDSADWLDDSSGVYQMIGDFGWLAEHIQGEVCLY